MKVTVVECPCRNPKRHVKFQDETGRRTANGIFSLSEGRYILTALKNRGDVTEAEVVSANAELVATGLPEYAEFTDAELEKEALEIIEMFDSRDKANKAITRKVEQGLLSAVDADRLRKMICGIVDGGPLAAVEALLRSLESSAVER